MPRQRARGANAALQQRLPRAEGRGRAAALRIPAAPVLRVGGARDPTRGTTREVTTAAGGAGSKAICKAEQCSVSNCAKVTFPGVGGGGCVFAEGVVCKPGKKGVEIQGRMPGVGRCLVPSPLHPPPEQLGRTLGCPGWGSCSSPHPKGGSGSAIGEELRPCIQINSVCSFTSSCSDGGVSGRLWSARHPPGWPSRALAPQGFLAIDPLGIPGPTLSCPVVPAGDGDGDGARREHKLSGHPCTQVPGASCRTKHFSSLSMHCPAETPAVADSQLSFALRKPKAQEWSRASTNLPARRGPGFWQRLWLGGPTGVG